ncbi:flagellar export chaperone FliS [Sulfurospirillum sp. hDNRA2]|uniref:flagellar export chaperone FliS n=3 Tax=Sulfurospirillum TaxID=57665 RepID=UPI000A42BCA3|nr:flagellar export chaperone FliS [Sulfurospirillum sp. DNRA8]MCP3651330.1 flagellar export chaperone FliS [Sulfurospirillum sp. DNRA8]MCR1810177.1 flagellar export chaperone FliS [Sulfurospirillum sp. DNRA8]
MYSNLAYSTYSQNNISIESPEKLIKMLYEGILRFASQAKRAIEDGNIEKRTYWINRTSAIFAELIHSLNYDNGRVAYYLQGLYTYQLKLLSEANLNNDTEKLDQVMNVARGLLDAWKDETENVME